MKRLVPVLIVLAASGGLAGCGEVGQALNRVKQDERLLKENEAKIEAGLKKLDEATKRAHTGK